MKVRNQILSKRGILLALSVVLAFALFDGLVRSFAGEPQLFQDHVRYSWLNKAGVRQCIVAIRGKPAEKCTTFTKEQIETYRLQYEIPSSKVLAGEF